MGIILILVLVIGFMFFMAHFSRTAGKTILIIALPFFGAGVGFLMDIAVASDAVTWFPCLWMYGGMAGFIGSIILAVIPSKPKNDKKSQDSSSPKLEITFELDETKNQRK